MRREVRSVRVQREEVRSDKSEGDREMVGKNEERGIKRERERRGEERERERVEREKEREWKTVRQGESIVSA